MSGTTSTVQLSQTAYFLPHFSLGLLPEACTAKRQDLHRRIPKESFQDSDKLFKPMLKGKRPVDQWMNAQKHL